MQEEMLWEGDTCPLCELQGFRSKLKFFRLNLREAALLCKRKKCPFPLSTNYPDMFVRIGKDGNIVPGSQSERGLQHEEGGDADDSPYISDASEESVKFSDSVPEVEPVHISSENTNDKCALEVDAFDISNIDFETDDSLDTFKLRNEITSLEMEITKSVENMKSALPHVNRKDSSAFNKNSEKCINSGLVTVKAFARTGDKVCTDTQKELDINGTSYVKLNENGVDYRKSGNIILREHHSPTGLPGSLEFTKISEELANCVQQSNVNMLVSNKCNLNHKYADVQNNSNRNFRGGGCTVDGDRSSVLENVESIISCSDRNVQNQLDMLTKGNTTKPERNPPIILIPMDTENAVGNDLSLACELQAELVTNESVTFKKDNIYENEICNNKEVVIVFDDLKNSDCSDNSARKQLDTIVVAGVSNTEPEPSVLLTPQTTEHTVGNSLPRNCELLAELASSKSVTIKKDNDCWKEMCDNKEMIIIFDDHKNSDCSDNNEGKQLDTVSVADTMNPEPELSVLLTSQDIKSIVGNGLPRKHELLEELVSSESATINKDTDCRKEKDDIKEMFIISDDHINTDGSDNIAEKQLNTLPRADTSNPRPEQSVLLTPQSTKNTVENYLPRKCEVLTELVGSESVSVKKVNDCGKKCDNEIDIVLKGNENSEVYEIVAFEGDTSSTASLNNSRNYEVINLQLRFCDNQKSGKGNAGRKTTKVRHRVQNTVEQPGKRSSGARSNSKVVKPYVKLKVLGNDGLFRCTTNTSSSGISEAEKAKQFKNTYARKTVHSENCVCFLCSEYNTKGITSHLDRALADLFPEECSTGEHLTERDLPTEKEVMRDLVHFMAGNTNLQKRKKIPLKRGNGVLHL